MKESSRIYFQSLSYFTFVTLIVALSTLLLHESGHAAFGMAFGCKDVKIIIFDSLSAYPYTEMTCNNMNPLLMGFSSFILVLPFLVFYFLSPHIPERFLPLMMIGFNFMISSWDLQTYVYDKIFFPVFLVGSALLLYSEVMFIEEEGFFLKHIIRRKGENIYDH
jgi:hypothetical protein